MLRRLSLLLLSAMCWLAHAVAHADALVVIVTSDQGVAYAQAADVLTQELTRQGVPASSIRRVEAAAWLAGSDALFATGCYVTLGTPATEALAQRRVSAPVLAALLPRASFERVRGSKGIKASSLFTAIYLDQPLQRQLAMIKTALPQVERLGVLWGPDSRAKAPLLRSVAKASGIAVQEAGMEENSDLFKALQLALTRSDAFLALADPQVFNATTIQNILLTTLRARVPVVAFSPAYVRAGALLALYTTPEQTGKQAAALVISALHGKPLPPAPVESDDFEVAVNSNVANALGLSLDSDAIRGALAKLEHAP